MQVIGKDVQELGVEKKLIRSPLEFFRYERKNRGDGLGGCATQCQSGRSMIEMLGVLAIIGVLSVGGIMGYSKAMMRYKINKTIEQITYIAGNIRTTFANQGNYDGVNYTDVEKKAHIFPDDMWKDGEYYPQSVWGNDVYVDYRQKNSADTRGNKAFTLELDYIPEEACIELVTHDWRDAQVKMIHVEEGGAVYFTLPVAMDDAVSACTNAYNGEEYEGNLTMMIRLYFDIDVNDSYWQQKLENCSLANGGC